MYSEDQATDPSQPHEPPQAQALVTGCRGWIHADGRYLGTRPVDSLFVTRAGQERIGNRK
jgi:hypothetical protein